jgi:hypothetical protein
LGISSIFTGGNLNINGGNLGCYISTRNLNNVNVQNSTMLNLGVTYDNLTLENNVDVQNNNN